MSDEEDFNDGDNDGGDEKYFVEERGAYDRSGLEDPFSAIFEKPEPSDEEEHKQWIKGLNKRERFYYTLKAEVIPRIEEEYQVHLDKQILVDKTMYLNGIEYKNPWAFIIAFMATKNGTTMKKNQILDAINKIPPFIKEQNGIYPEDVIRYCRYIKNISI